MDDSVTPRPGPIADIEAWLSRQHWRWRDTGSRRISVKHEAVTRVVIQSAIDVHSSLGPGLLESSYEACLCHELASRGMPFRRQVPVSIEYQGAKLGCAYRIDLLVADVVVVELKTVDRLLPIHKAQLLTYLRHSRRDVGLLLNFNTIRLKDGIMRVVV